MGGGGGVGGWGGGWVGGWVGGGVGGGGVDGGGVPMLHVYSKKWSCHLSLIINGNSMSPTWIQQTYRCVIGK